MSRSPSQKLPNCLDIVDRLMPKGTVLGGDQTLALHFLATSFLVIDLEQFFNDEQIEAIIAASSRITDVMVDQSQAQFQPQLPSKENAAVIQVAHALLVMREVKALFAELKNGGKTSWDKLCNFYLAPYLRLASVLAKLQTAFNPDDQRSKVAAAQLAKVKQVIFTISDAVSAAMVENDSDAWSLVHTALCASNDIYSDELALEVLKKIESALDAKLLDLRGVPESLNKFNDIKKYYLSVSKLIRFFSNRIAAIAAQFKEKADRFSFIQAAAEGFLLAGDSAGLRQLLPKFEAAVAFRKKSRTYSEDALFLARCKVVCAEDDKEFLTGLYGYFNQMPLPSKDFFKLVMPRAKAIYYDQRGRFSVEERHFAYQVFLGYERNTRHHVVLFNDPAPFPTDLVRPLEWYPETYIKQSLSSLKAADISGFDFEKRRAARGWEPSDEEQIMRQSILPILRQFNFIERYYYYKIFNNDSIGTKVSDRNNPENMQQYCIPLFFSAVEDVAFEYEKRLEQLEEMHSPSYEAGQTIFILRQFVYALLEARALKAIGQFLEKGESYQDKDFHALEALLYGSKVVQLRDTARTEVLSSILQSEPVRGLISYASLGFKGALTNLLSAKGLDPFIMRNLRSIVDILKTLCLEAINPEYSSGLSDEVKLNALVFLLREPVYATLADEEKAQVIDGLGEEYQR
ncbi:MAG: hypothetical protein KDH94_00775, partial [Coxiellaceae bacterium]|nr:hypothetical protein [Coxiellaceae bacterium]